MQIRADTHCSLERVATCFKSSFSPRTPIVRSSYCLALAGARPSVAFAPLENLVKVTWVKQTHSATAWVTVVGLVGSTSYGGLLTKMYIASHRLRTLQKSSAFDFDCPVGEHAGGALNSRRCLTCGTRAEDLTSELGPGILSCPVVSCFIAFLGCDL